MLSIDKISNDKDETLKGLEKRGFKNLGVIDEIIELNNSRKKINCLIEYQIYQCPNYTVHRLPCKTH